MEAGADVNIGLPQDARPNIDKSMRRAGFNDDHVIGAHFPYFIARHKPGDPFLNQDDLVVIVEV